LVGVADYVTIANLALSKLGEDDQIRDPDQDSHAARSVRAVWDPVRRFVLRKGKFNFAMKRAELAAQASSSPGYESSYPFTNRFPVPDGFVRLVEVLGPASVVEAYKYERKAILADSVGPVFIRYVADVAETGDWDDLFVQAFAARLAFQIADRITGDRGRKADAFTEWRLAIKEAAGVDAKEDPPEEPYESSWVTSRFGGPAVRTDFGA
jgi:hypothetical protein